VADSKASIRGKIGVIGDFVVGVVERMGIGPFEISEDSEGDFLIYQLRGTAAQSLGEGDGRASEALQLLANQAAMREMEEAPRVIVDLEGEGERREGFLERLADRAAGRALDTGRSVALDPMNPKDRRILHVTVREIDDVATMSVGSGRYRQVVIVPKGADEYEDALDSGRESSRGD
jgi:spoIIIJ-associated protein